MNDFTKISYYDLRWEGLHRRIVPLVGRTDELDRLSRIVGRKTHNNALLVGPGGIGKTAFIRGWALQAIKQNNQTSVVELDASSFYPLGASTVPGFAKYQEALERLPASIVCIDNFGRLVHNKPALFQQLARLLHPLLQRPDVPVLLTLEPAELNWIEHQEPGWLGEFETLSLKPQPAEEQIKILEQALPALQSGSRAGVPRQLLELIVEYAERFHALGQLPGAGMKLLDESLALAAVHGTKTVSAEDIQRIVADKTNIPLHQLRANEIELLRGLEASLNKRIIGQDQPLRSMTSAIQRAKLGLKNPNRPLGSFLLLGPSGVGKTETSKLLAELLFGKKESFLRIDMSEFGESHTVQRLVGAPPGYVGYDAGGGLTSPVKQEPHSLVLLDEIEKAHPKVFDVFLQILDDGRLTSGQGETVDFTQAIIVATSNMAVGEIVEGFRGGQDIHSEAFRQNVIFPVLTKTLRPEFLNRFDSVLIFNPLTEQDLLDIALLEIKKIEQRVAKHKIRFSIDPEMLRQRISGLSDLRYGARPVKRFVEETCETLITQTLLK